MPFRLFFGFPSLNAAFRILLMTRKVLQYRRGRGFLHVLMKQGVRSSPLKTGSMAGCQGWPLGMEGGCSARQLPAPGSGKGFHFFVNCRKMKYGLSGDSTTAETSTSQRQPDCTAFSREASPPFVPDQNSTFFFFVMQWNELN